MNAVVFLGENQEPVEGRYIGTSDGIMNIRMEDKKITNYVGQVVYTADNRARKGLVYERAGPGERWNVAWDLQPDEHGQLVLATACSAESTENLKIEEISENYPTRERAPPGRLLFSQGRRGDRIQIASARPQAGPRDGVHGTIWRVARDCRTRYTVLWDDGEIRDMDVLDEPLLYYFNPLVKSNLSTVPVTRYERGLFVVRECEPARVGRMVSFIPQDQKAKVIWDIEYGNSYSWENLVDLLHADDFTDKPDVFDYVEFYNSEKEKKDFGTIFDETDKFYLLWLNCCRVVKLSKTSAWIRVVREATPTWVYGQLVGKNTRQFDRITGGVDSGHVNKPGTVVTIRNDALEIHFDGQKELIWFTLEPGKIQLIHTPRLPEPRLPDAAGQMVSVGVAAGAEVMQISSGLVGLVVRPEHRPFSKTALVKWKWNPSITENVPWTDLMYYRAVAPRNVSVVAPTKITVTHQFCTLLDETRRRAYLVTLTPDSYISVVSNEGKKFVGKMDSKFDVVDICRQLEEVGFIEEHSIANECLVMVKDEHRQNVILVRLSV